jgi:hypothetical protein
MHESLDTPAPAPGKDTCWVVSSYDYLALRAELERVKGELAKEREFFATYREAASASSGAILTDAVADEIAALTATNARLREALTECKRIAWEETEYVYHICEEVNAALADLEQGEDK